MSSIMASCCVVHATGMPKYQRDKNQNLIAQNVTAADTFIVRYSLALIAAISVDFLAFDVALVTTTMCKTKMLYEVEIKLKIN